MGGGLWDRCGRTRARKKRNISIDGKKQTTGSISKEEISRRGSVKDRKMTAAASKKVFQLHRNSIQEGNRAHKGPPKKTADVRTTRGKALGFFALTRRKGDASHSLKQASEGEPQNAG